MAIRMEIGTDSALILTEFQKPGLRPLQSRPVQAVSHALNQASKVGCCGKEKISPSRISGSVLSEVVTITQSGRRKKIDAMIRNA